ncbi:unnamed protein product [Zymoseptoria tritici ST99CH_3D7]|uniref:Uncharacterized protein n=1 Tax=Zymoseptoria tritici (strain ST99CH_3D7) TaxID=1276538 RepID=A0A1X7S110_ZYMT9|nr:unnamed protein product [Zymoseptoria tritici ST99CH_3D7]
MHAFKVVAALFTIISIVMASGRDDPTDPEWYQWNMPNICVKSGQPCNSQCACCGKNCIKNDQALYCHAAANDNPSASFVCE